MDAPPDPNAGQRWERGQRLPPRALHLLRLLWPWTHLDLLASLSNNILSNNDPDNISNNKQAAYPDTNASPDGAHSPTAPPRLG
jgi:hypothetical protein